MHYSKMYYVFKVNKLVVEMHHIKSSTQCIMSIITKMLVKATNIN